MVASPAFVLLLSLLLVQSDLCVAYHEGCPAEGYLEYWGKSCVAVYMNHGHPEKKKACLGASVTFRDGFVAPKVLQPVGSLLVRKNCVVEAYQGRHFRGMWKYYKAGLYPLNAYFWLGRSNVSEATSVYGWRSFKCYCNVTVDEDKFYEPVRFLNGKK